MTVKDIQKALTDQGFKPGPIDGSRGRRTIKAIKEFQRAHDLTADGLVGAKTSALLFKNIDLTPGNTFDIPVTMPWLETAFSLIGTKEKPGSGSNEAIIDWAENLSLLDYDDDDIPWCGLFVAHCIGSQLPEEVLPTNPLGARRWQKFGREILPQVGAVMVFWRGSKDGWKGHVGLYWAEDDKAYHILGGNQSNSVSITRINKDRLLTARWPETGLSPEGKKRIAQADGKLLSVNEA